MGRDTIFLNHHFWSSKPLLLKITWTKPTTKADLNSPSVFGWLVRPFLEMSSLISSDDKFCPFSPLTLCLLCLTLIARENTINCKTKAGNLYHEIWPGKKEKTKKTSLPCSHDKVVGLNQTDTIFLVIKKYGGLQAFCLHKYWQVLLPSAQANGVTVVTGALLYLKS